ncbi:MAG: S1 family peptidase [Bifidobacteriaceae bacterium]|jgi:hypothetical protein|nr:S1 family peptidase [Bifidobacteriaceae bacterium]
MKRPAHRPRGLATLVTVLLTVGLPASTHATPWTADDTGTGSSEDTFEFPPPPDPSSDVHGVGILEVAADFRAAALELLGDRFVEFWLTPEQDHYVVGVHDLTADEAPAISDSLSQIAQVEVVSRQVSRGQLDEFAATVEAKLAEGIAWTSFGVNYESGTVVLELPPGSDYPAVAEAFADLDGGLILTGEAAKSTVVPFGNATLSDVPRLAILPDLVSATSQENMYSTPFRAGKSLVKHDMTEWVEACTSAFVLRGGTDPQNYYALTAGHCDPGWRMFGLGSKVEGSIASTTGTVKALSALLNNTYWDHEGDIPADAGVVGLPANVSPSPSVYVNSSLQRSVTGQASPPLYARGCFNGVTTPQEKCGTVTSYNTPVYFGPDPRTDNKHHWLQHATLITWDPVTWNYTDYGDSGGPLYSVNPDGTAVALGVLSGGYRDVENHPTNVSIFSDVSYAISATGTQLHGIDRSPFWCVDLVSGGAGTVTVAGWIIDPDLPATPMSIHVYLGGPAGIGESVAVPANLSRPDVANAYPNTGSNHGFAAQISTARRGNVPVYIYAINLGVAGGANNVTMWSGTAYVS